MTLIADVFPQLPALKNMIRQISKKSCFRRDLDRQHGKWVEKLLEYERQYFSNNY